MCAASAPAPIPRYNEGKQYWERLTDACKRHVECVNATLLKNRVDPGGLLECIFARDSLQITKPRHPAVKIELNLDFRSWGPVIGATFTGEESDGKKFLPKEFELPIATDVDTETVAIYDEGRSFSPREVASYLMQYFHCCYPEISFPC